PVLCTPPPLLRCLSRSPFLLNHPSPPELSTLSLHDALPILIRHNEEYERVEGVDKGVILHLKSGKKIKADGFLWCNGRTGNTDQDRKSTRLNSSHVSISYAVFCLKKKKEEKTDRHEVATDRA